jgi:hypothetical protein
MRQYTEAFGTTICSPKKDSRMTSRDVTSLPRNPRIRTIPYNEQAITPIGDLLEAEVGTADFQLPSSTVYQMTVPGVNGRPTAMVTL